MTFKSLMNFGLGDFRRAPYAPIERYHGNGGNHHHGSHGGSKSKGGSGAALSALTLLAFLFLINVMQQSLQDNNSTTPTTTAVLLRDTEFPVVLDTKEDNDINMKSDFIRVTSTYGSPPRTIINDYKQREG